jgi:hypothetical protein
MIDPEAQAILDAYFSRHPTTKRGRGFGERDTEDARDIARRVLTEAGWAADLEPPEEALDA